MFTLGLKNTPSKVLKNKVPHIPKLKEADPRTKFFEYNELKAVIAELPQFYNGPVIFAYETGWSKSEVFNLEWKNVNFKENTVTLDVGVGITETTCKLIKQVHIQVIRLRISSSCC